MNITEELAKKRLVPVLEITDVNQVDPISEILLETGIGCAEITFRTAAAADAIRAMSQMYPEIITGAGTVLTKEQVDNALAAGAKFLVSPGFDREVTSYALSKNAVIFPGIITPSELQGALSLGLDHVKFFPAEAAGGLKMIKALSAPYGAVRFMPTGGINAGNIKEYLSFDKIFACGGSWMISKALLKEGDYDTIRKLCKEARELVDSI
ncbi:MAG: bifunctional 4-hydroxy-2-oxoglutarate aldolase/2-dehydro-3-deoxy-phosphogluconate aldolase [Lachnospiraceae bacterium]|nr:bifunctional 4-hydroxy-2-oxoglutarate aldolase/2-dehydro-3-deoxy-phosphogluconate aldolase [Lachnospiraceae bacterium]